jgi:hypothetical protein
MLGVYFRDRKTEIKEKRTMKWNILKFFKKKQKVEEQKVEQQKEQLTPRQFVLSKFPNAVCMKSDAFGEGKYIISKGSEKISICRSKTKAWRQASHNLKGK